MCFVFVKLHRTNGDSPEAFPRGLTTSFKGANTLKDSSRIPRNAQTVFWWSLLCSYTYKNPSMMGHKKKKKD